MLLGLLIRSDITLTFKYLLNLACVMKLLVKLQIARQITMADVK